MEEKNAIQTRSLIQTDTRPLMVSIRCITYNHEPYIRQCLEGFVMQKTNFRFEAIVHDDASTDGTVAIIREYAERYPDIIKPIYETENQYSKHDGSLNRIMDAACTGKYLAFCEGDDCWTDPYKLQKQVDYLESHLECVLVHTDLSVQDVNTGEMEHFKWKRQRNYNQIERDWGDKLVSLILQGKYSVQTLTVCARMDSIRRVRDEYPEMADKKLLMGDTPLWMALAKKGTFHFIPEETACYHVISESATHSKNYSNVINFYVSCLYMVEKFSALFGISDKDKDSAIQAYIYFLLKDIYTDKREYRQEVEDKILRERALDKRNAFLLGTMDCGFLIKRICSLGIQTIVRISHHIGFWRAKYFYR